MDSFIGLIIPAFIAGVLTFLAPCTLPLVPGYIGFISGVTAKDLEDKKNIHIAKKRIIQNGLLYILGFSIVFILLGTAFGIVGTYFTAHRLWLSRIGGLFVIFFGLYLMHVFDVRFLQFLQTQKRFSLINKLKPGKPSSSFLFGVTFALGWTPCVGPILGSILLLASTTGTIVQGALLLSIFSLGLALPFILIALGFSHAAEYVKKISKYLKIISFIGGLFLVFLGLLLITDSMAQWTSFVYYYFQFINTDWFFNHV